MNIWLKILTGIGGFILFSVIYSLAKEMIYLVRESHTIRMYDSRTDRLDLLANIYTTASNVYIQFAQKGVVLVDYAQLTEVAIYGLVKELGGDASTLLQKIQKSMNKLQNIQGGGKPAIITPDIKGPKSDKLNMSDKEIDEILNKWEKEHPEWRDKGKKD